jgi:ribosome silencing factor RsfS/YbeB/iojap
LATKSTKSPTATDSKTRSSAAAKKAPAARKAPAVKKATAAKKSDAKAVPARKPAAKSAPARKPAAKATVPAAKKAAPARNAAPAQPKARKSAKLDVRGKTSIADYIVVAGGTSSRHVRSIADEVIKYAKKAGMIPLGVEGQREGEWVLVDLGDIIIHVMLPRVREFYGLERLWTVGGEESSEAAYA